MNMIQDFRKTIIDYNLCKKIMNKYPEPLIKEIYNNANI